jgi:hypothetical protein
MYEGIPRDCPEKGQKGVWPKGLRFRAVGISVQLPPILLAYYAEEGIRTPKFAGKARCT